MRIFLAAVLLLTVPASAQIVGVRNRKVFSSGGGISIAFDNAVVSSLAVGVTSKTQSFTTGAGTNRLLFVGVKNFSGSTAPSSVTYAGSAMTLLTNTAYSSSSRSLWLYAIVAPTTGANNIVVNFAASTSLYVFAESFSGAFQSTTMDAVATPATGSATSAAPSLTTVANNCWTLGFFDVDATTTITAGSGTTFRATGASGDAPAIGDSNAPISPAGSTALHSTFGTSGSFGALMVSFKHA